MKVKMTRATGYPEGSVETVLHNLGIWNFERQPDNQSFVCEMSAQLVEDYRVRYFQPHGLVVLEGDPEPAPAQASGPSPSELEKARMEGFADGWNQARQEVFAFLKSCGFHAAAEKAGSIPPSHELLSAIAGAAKG